MKRKTVIDITKFMKPDPLDNPNNTYTIEVIYERISHAILTYVSLDHQATLNDRFASICENEYHDLLCSNAFRSFNIYLYPEEDSENMTFLTLEYRYRKLILDTLSHERSKLRALFLSYGYYVHVELDTCCGRAYIVIHNYGPTLGDMIFKFFHNKLCREYCFRRCGLK